MGGRTSLSWKLNNGQIQFRFICLWKLISYIYKLGISENSREMFWEHSEPVSLYTQVTLLRKYLTFLYFTVGCFVCEHHSILLFYCEMLCVRAPQYQHIYVYISTHTNITYTYLYLCIDVRSYINTVLTYKNVFV